MVPKRLSRIRDVAAVSRLLVPLFLLGCWTSGIQARLVDVTFSGTTISALGGGIRERFPIGTPFSVSYTYDLSADSVSAGARIATYVLSGARITLGDYPTVNVAGPFSDARLPIGTMLLFEGGTGFTDLVQFNVVQTPPTSLPGIPVTIPGLPTFEVRPMGFGVQLEGLLLSSPLLKPEAFPIESLRSAQLFMNFTTGEFPGVPYVGGTHLSGLITATFVSPVPEPESYALMLIGLGLVAGVVRRRRRQTVGGEVSRSGKGIRGTAATACQRAGGAPPAG